MTASGMATDGWAIRAAGDRAWLIEVGPAIDAADVALALRRARIAGIEDVLPAAATVLVTVRSPRDAEQVRRAAHDLLSAVAPVGTPRTDGAHVDNLRAGNSHADTSLGDLSHAGTSRADVSRGTIHSSSGAPPAGAAATGDPDPVIIPVHYDGEDLAHVADLLGTTAQEVIDRHAAALWRCEFVGFAPGFGYLRAPGDPLSVPRRDRARTTVPAGAVALAGGYSAVYPRSSPGGWQLIGHTDEVLWDERRDPPALVRSGGAVRFVVAGR